jgi:hypothetical protein
MFLSRVLRLARALREAQEIVRLITVGLSLDIFVAGRTDRHDHFHVPGPNANMELPITHFNSFDRLLLGYEPPLSSIINSADVGDPFMGIEAIQFVDA